MEEIIVRNAKPEDAKAIQHIICQGWSQSAAYQNIFGKKLQYINEITSRERVEKRKEKLGTQDNNSLTIVAENMDGILLGVCSGGLQCEGEELTNLSTTLDYEKYGELRVLYIKPGNQRNGIGGLLINKLEKRIYSHKKKGVILKTLQYNEQSNQFYQKQGYVLTPYTCTFTRRDITTPCNIYIKHFNE